MQWLHGKLFLQPNRPPADRLREQGRKNPRLMVRARQRAFLGAEIANESPCFGRLRSEFHVTVCASRLPRPHRGIGRGEVGPAPQPLQLVNKFQYLTRRSEGVSREDQFGCARWGPIKQRVEPLDAIRAVLTPPSCRRACPSMHARPYRQETRCPRVSPSRPYLQGRSGCTMIARP
jgi:hypothetical protein